MKVAFVLTLLAMPTISSAVHKFQIGRSGHYVQYNHEPDATGPATLSTESGDFNLNGAVQYRYELRTEIAKVRGITHRPVIDLYDFHNQRPIIIESDDREFLLDYLEKNYCDASKWLVDKVFRMEDGKFIVLQDGVRIPERPAYVQVDEYHDCFGHENRCARFFKYQCKNAN